MPAFALPEPAADIETLVPLLMRKAKLAPTLPPTVTGTGPRVKLPDNFKNV